MFKILLPHTHSNFRSTRVFCKHPISNLVLPSSYKANLAIRIRLAHSHTVAHVVSFSYDCKQRTPLCTNTPSSQAALQVETLARILPGSRVLFVCVAVVCNLIHRLHSTRIRRPASIVSPRIDVNAYQSPPMEPYPAASLVL